MPPELTVLTLDESTWRARASAHETRVDALVSEHLARRAAGEAHPVHDFLFTYYSYRPARLRRWHPGFGVVLAGVDAAPAPAYRVVRLPTRHSAFSPSQPTGGVTVSEEYAASRAPLVGSIHRLLTATAARAPHLGCFGLHEWAMVHATDEARHPWPLRLGRAGTDAVVESHRIACSHFDAYRFFTPTARPLNALRPAADDRPAYEQPGCLHAGMDLYKHAFRLSPLVPSELVADCFELARDIRVLDMRAAPYDLSVLGFSPVRIETAGGKQEYASAQRRFAERAAPLRSVLLEWTGRLLDQVADSAACTSAPPTTTLQDASRQRPADRLPRRPAPRTLR